MKNVFFIAIMAWTFIMLSCTKTSFIDSADAVIDFSEDTLHFDTVFTTAGSITQQLKIFNLNDKKLRFTTISLSGGNVSPFKINVDGSAGTVFNNIEVEPNDSIYVFVTVTINPSAANLPFIVQDSILVSYNGNNKYIQLDAYGQNAHFLKGKRITTDSSWNNDLPFVILDSLSVDENVSLTIGPGCKIYHHANAPFIINGSLKINGDSNARVTFAGDRLDPVYKDLPGSWPGLIFNESSTNNLLNYTIIRNAYQGIATTGKPTLPFKITLHQCIIDNIYDAGIFSEGSSIQATNCLISNCGANLFISSGGKYNFDYCTIATYGNLFIAHQTPVVTINDADFFGINTYNLDAVFRNCILYGANGSVDDEIVVNKTGNAFNLNFQNILYKNKTTSIDGYVNTAIKNELPEFVNIDISKNIYDFRLKEISPAINQGNNYSNTPVDLDGKPRPPGITDIGCYQKQ